MIENTIAEPSAHLAQTLAKRAIVTSRAQDCTGIPADAARVLNDAAQRRLGRGLYAPEQIARWRKVTRAVHDKGGQMFVQLWYVGCHADAVESDGLWDLAEDFRVAASQAIAAGFDGVELHVNNGFLLEQFLKSASVQHAPLVPSLEQRARLLLDIITAVATEIGADRTGVLIAPASSAHTPANSAGSPQYSFISGRLGVAYLRVAEGAMSGLREDRPFDCHALRAHFGQPDQALQPLGLPQDHLGGAEPSRAAPAERRMPAAPVSMDRRDPGLVRPRDSESARPGPNAQRARRQATPETPTPRREPRWQAAITA